MMVTEDKELPYEKLKFYQNICGIRKIIVKTTDEFPARKIRLVSQMQDAARSAKQNIIEGYKKDSAGAFANSIKISRGSLGELSGDWDDCYEDGLIEQEAYQKLKELIKKTDFLIDHYLDSLYKLSKEGKWKSRFKKG